MSIPSTPSMLGAIMHSKVEEVKRLAEQKQGLNERSDTDHGTPIIYAAATDQWSSVEILIDNGADIWTHNEFGMTAEQLAMTSRILPGSKEDDARQRVIKKFKDKGYPFPPPDSESILALEKEGRWPPAEVRR